MGMKSFNNKIYNPRVGTRAGGFAGKVQILGRDPLARVFATHYHVIARNNSWPIPTEILKIRINSFPQHTIEKDSKTLSKDICHLFPKLIFLATLTSS